MDVVILALLSTSLTADPVQWRTEFKAAAVEAQNQSKPLFISIHTEWCGPCKAMHQTTMRDPAVVELLNTRCIPLLLDGDREKELMNAWRVSAYPTQIIVGTVGAVRTQVLERIEGKVTANELVAALQRAVKRQSGAVASARTGRDSKPDGPAPKDAIVRTSAIGPIKTPSPMDAESVVKPAALKSVDPLAPPEAKMSLALEGHCPVCMIDRAEMVVGKASESTVYNGRKYQFSSAENKRRFMASPAKYLPGAGGDCVVTLAEKGKHVPGDTRCPAMFRDKVYLLADKQCREKFLKDPEAYVDAKGEPLPIKAK